MKKQTPKREKVVVSLSEKEVAVLEQWAKSGKKNARTVVRARILLLSHRGKTNREITDALGCGHSAIADMRTRYRERISVDAALEDAPRSGQPKKITANHETFVIATACTDAPDGHNHWTLEALKQKLLETYPKLTSISHERVRHILMQAALKPWREKNVVHPASHPRVSRVHG